MEGVSLSELLLTYAESGSVLLRFFCLLYGVALYLVKIGLFFNLSSHWGRSTGRRRFPLVCVTGESCCKLRRLNGMQSKRFSTIDPCTLPEVGSFLPVDLTRDELQSLLACIYAGARRSVLLNQDKLIML